MSTFKQTMAGKFFWVWMQRMIYILCVACTLHGCHLSRTEKEIKCLPKSSLPAQAVSPDTLSLPFLFYPERWFLNDSRLYVLNSKTEPFLSVCNLSDGSWMQWGRMGNGPGEFVIPSLCEMKAPRQVGIYSNSLNRLEVYQVRPDTLVSQGVYAFPLWNKERGIPKAYTRMLQYDDSLFVGTSFMPRQVSVDLLDLKNSKVIDEAPLSLHPSEDEYAGPYECKVAVGDGYMVAAYKYTDRLDVFRISPHGFKLLYTIGDAVSQYDLYRQERDDEMVCHYTDVVCGKDRIYALHQGVEYKDLPVAESKLEIYAITGEPLQTLNLGRSMAGIVVDERSGRVYAYDRNEENDLLYCYTMK